MSLKVNDGKIPRADLYTVISNMEKVYPGRKVLVQTKNGVKCRVLDILVAPVAGHHNKKHDLMEVEEVVDIPNPEAGNEGQPKTLLAPNGRVFRTHMGIADVIGMM